MRPLRNFALVLFIALPALAQTAPQRSNELCSALREIAAENGRKFSPMRPGSCSFTLDTGYDLLVSYNERSLNVTMMVGVNLLNGDASALWLHLSTLDGLAHVALGTKLQAVFDESSRLLKEITLAQSKPGNHGYVSLNGKADKALLSADHLAIPYAMDVIDIDVAADVKDIDRMARAREREASGELPAWRRVLGLSLQAFGAGAQAYVNAYRGASAPQWQTQPIYTAPKTCYTNFLGPTMFTNCY